MDIALRFTMSSIIYIHHEGQFKSPDGDTKVRAEAGKMLFMDTRHDVCITLYFLYFSGPKKRDKLKF